LITPLARVVANRALARGFDQATDEMMRPFFYLPLMHSELLADQDRSVRLHEAFGDPELLKYATLHRDIVVKFRRFPHRNRAMGHDATPDMPASSADLRSSKKVLRNSSKNRISSAFYCLMRNQLAGVAIRAIDHPIHHRLLI
jgi:Bacterial protein of unknown function (DUF924)